MPRPASTAYRFDDATKADILALAARLRTSASGAIREAVRRLALAELGGKKTLEKAK